MPYRRYVSATSAVLIEQLRTRAKNAAYDVGVGTPCWLDEVPSKIAEEALVILERPDADRSALARRHELDEGWILELTDRSTMLRWPDDEDDV